MKKIKRFLCVVLTLLLVVPGCLAEDMAQALTTGTEELRTSFEDDVSSASVDNNDGAATAETAEDEDATLDENVAISISPIDSDVAEAGEMDLVPDDGDVQALSIPADYIDASSASTVTYCFIALDTLVASRTAVEGEKIVAPDDPAAPEGMVFAGWELEDGTAVFVDDAPVIAVTDPMITEINVIAQFAAAEIPADPAAPVPSDEDTGLQDAAEAAGDESVSNETESIEEPGEGSAPTVADETTSVVADETEPGVDNDPEADEDAGTDGNADEEDADAINDADAEKDDEAANAAETVNNADVEKDAEEDNYENAGAIGDDSAEGESNGDEDGGEDIGEDRNQGSDDAQAPLPPSVWSSISRRRMRLSL